MICIYMYIYIYYIENSVYIMNKGAKSFTLLFIICKQIMFIGYKIQNKRLKLY